MTLFDMGRAHEEQVRELRRGLTFNTDSVEGMLADRAESKPIGGTGLPHVEFETRRWLKTQTRRIVKLPPGLQGRKLVASFVREDGVTHGLGLGDDVVEVKSPFGKSGDLVYVREPWFAEKRFDDQRPRQLVETYRHVNHRGEVGPRFRHLLWFHGDPDPETDSRGMTAERGRYRNAMFLPRAFCRIVLEILLVTPLNLHRMTDDDKRAEGAPRSVCDSSLQLHLWFREHWDKINGAGSFDSNPVVWRVAFRVTSFRPAKGRTIQYPPTHPRCRSTLTA